MNWTEVCENRQLQDLPFKVELDRWGKIVMSPASNRHGYVQTVIAACFMQNRKGGKVITECSVETSRGVKVADVAWGSKGFFDRNGLDTPYREAPEICVEVVSPSNSDDEIAEKVELYLARGAKEVWVCHETGQIKLYSHRGEIPASSYFDEIPTIDMG
jgi:Uma2 family endonuclease